MCPLLPVQPALERMALWMALWMAVLTTGASSIVVGQPVSTCSPDQQEQVARIATQWTQTEAPPADARAQLQAVVDDASACTVPPHGAAAYWLGRTHEAHRERLQIWWNGLNALQEHPHAPFDARLADAFVHHTFATSSRPFYRRAAQMYLALLEAGPREESERAASTIAKHLRWTAPLLPASTQARLRDGNSNNRAASGSRVAAWWRRQDPVPATVPNERLQEHLKRVAYARRAFQTNGQLDDRGFIYIRLGPPSRKTTIRFNSIRFTETVLSFGSRFASTDFRNGQFWVYDHISRATQYLFVETTRDVYTVGTVLSMLPSELQRGFSSARRGQAEAAAFIRALEEAYRQLAVYHDRYHAAYQEVSSYSLALDDGGDGNIARGTRPLVAKARRTLLDAKEENAFHERQRYLKTPKEYVEPSSGSVGTLPVAVRTARFQEATGRTRVDVFWSLPYSGLPNSDSKEPAAYVLDLAVVERDAHGRRDTMHRHSSLVSVDDPTRDAFLEPQTLHPTADTADVSTIDMQWTLYEAVPRAGTTPRAGAMKGRAVHRVDSLRALPRNAPAVHVSDIRPMAIPEGRSATAPVEEALPYPFERITSQTPLALYLEAYQLAYGPNQTTRYTVAYAVETEDAADDGAFNRETALSTTYEGTSRTAREYIVLDLSDQDVSEATDLRIRVRVIDEHTGMSADRTIDFQLAPLPQ